MNVFFSHDEDKNFEEGQVITYCGKVYYVESVRNTANGVWLELECMVE
jgi:hypothetical protein